MVRMVVTLDVSILSGWSKAAANCRVQRGHPIRETTHGTEMAQKEFRVQSLFEPNTANRPRKPYKPLLASNVRWHRKERANQQRTRRACVARLGSEGRRRRRKRT
eukprot:scaffold5380_cov62-Phaeocystis_antarctica.AAC.5